MIGAGDLREQVAFDAPVAISDGHGGVRDGFAGSGEAVNCYAHFRYLRGGETVQAARLEGRQPIVVTVRSSVATLAVRPDWRMRDRVTGLVYNIRTGPVRSDDRSLLEFTVESGVAV